MCDSDVNNFDEYVDDMAWENDNFVRRGVPSIRGVYIEGQVNGVDMTYTADTGASSTILSVNIFNKIDEKLSYQCGKHYLDVKLRWLKYPTSRTKFAPHDSAR